VGLIARGIEKQGISTVCVSFRKEITELSRPPRILSVKSSPGKPLGKPGDKRNQRKVIEAGFDLLQRYITDMTIVDLHFISS
jgi:hypothetical protein